jgi:hypothetical protein
MVYKKKHHSVCGQPRQRSNGKWRAHMYLDGGNHDGPERDDKVLAEADLARMRAAPRREDVPSVAAELLAEKKAAAMVAVSGAPQPSRSEQLQEAADAADAETPSKASALSHVGPTPEKQAESHGHRRRHSRKGPPEDVGSGAHGCNPRSASGTAAASTRQDVGDGKESICAEEMKIETAGSCNGAFEVAFYEGKWQAEFGIFSPGLAGPPRGDCVRAQKDLEFVRQASSTAEALERLDRLYKAKEVTAKGKQAWLEGKGSPEYPDAVWASFRAFHHAAGQSPSKQIIECGAVSPEIAALALAADRQIEAADAQMK